MKITWPVNAVDAENLYVLLANKIASEFTNYTEFGCNPVRITEMYIKGEEWQSTNEECVDNLWSHIERVGMTNLDDVSVIKARFILSLLPREDTSDQENRFDWLIEFARRLGFSLSRLEESVEKALDAFSRTYDK